MQWDGEVLFRTRLPSLGRVTLYRWVFVIVISAENDIAMVACHFSGSSLFSIPTSLLDEVSEWFRTQDITFRKMDSESVHKSLINPYFVSLIRKQLSKEACGMCTKQPPR